MRDFFRNSNDDRQTGPSKPGVIDTIGVGYSYLLSYPYIIVIPILLDLYLWLGLRLSSASLISRLSDWIVSADFDGESIVRFISRWEDTNILELASIQLYIFRMPTFMPLLNEVPEIRTAAWDPSIETAPWWIVLFVGLIALTAGLFIGAGYLSWMADVLGNDYSRPSAREIAGVAWQLAIWVVILAGLFLLVSGPILLTIMVFAAGGLPQPGFIALLLILPISFGFLFFFFSIYAIAVDGLSAMASLQASYQVVRHNFVQSLGFIAAFFLVTSGFPFVWRFLISNPAGALIAIVGNAFVASGMIASAMVFYRDRASIVAELSISPER